MWEKIDYYVTNSRSVVLSLGKKLNSGFIVKMEGIATEKYKG